MLDRNAIAELIPHSGAMCLLDEVTGWDAMNIRCVSRTHREPENPLRNGTRVPVLCGIEYAAQAMAVHGGLSGAVAERPRAGYLVSVREIACRSEWLDEAEGDLVVLAQQVVGEAQNAMYTFAVSCGSREILTGRATVVLDAAPEHP